MKNYLNRIKRAALIFMKGRYGPDNLGLALIVTGLLFQLFAVLLHSSLPILVTDALLLYETYRYLSKDTVKRNEENNRFMEMIRPIVHYVKYLQMQKNDKDHKYYLCPKCGQIVRVPRGSGKVEVTCPKCGEHFIRKR